MAVQLKFSGRERKIFIFLMISLFVYGTFYYVYQPLKKKQEQVKAKLLMTENKIKKNFKLVAESEREEKEYAVILEQFKQKGSDEEVISRMLYQIDTASEEVSVRIVDLKPQRVKKVDFYSVFSVDLTLEAEISKIMQFLHILQNPPFNYSVDKFQVRRKSSQGDTLRGEVVFSLIRIP